ncbi:MAG: class I SAM-dependent methyltransferase [Chthonomonadales bacterium]
MNTHEDWDTIWKWQWFRRATWQPYFRDANHPEGRAARTTPIWTWALQSLGCESVLDANVGLGLRAVLLAEAGFNVTGVDISPVAVLHASELAASRDLDFPIYVSECSDLASSFEKRFDSVINDSFVWILDRKDLLVAAKNIYTVLKPGGKLIFTGPDQHSGPMDRSSTMDHTWRSAPRFQIRSDYERDDTFLTLVVARDREEVGVVENYIFVVRDKSGVRLEMASICNAILWSYEDYESVLKEAGFQSVESIAVPVGRREHMLNVATK